MPTRNFWGKRIIHKDDIDSTRQKYRESDIRWEKSKIVLMVLLGVLYIYFMVQPQNWW